MTPIHNERKFLALYLIVSVPFFFGIAVGLTMIARDFMVNLLDCSVDPASNWRGPFIWAVRALWFCAMWGASYVSYRFGRSCKRIAEEEVGNGCAAAGRRTNSVVNGRF